MALDWRAGYRSSWRVYRVDGETWADSGMLSGVTEASVERGRETVGDALESGSMSVDVPVGGSFDPGYYRIVLYAEQGDDYERVELATLWCETTSGTVERAVDSLSVTCSSVLHPAETTAFETGSYAPSGVDGARYVADVLSQCINAPVSVDGSFTLDEAYVFEPGEMVLPAVWKLLDAGKFCLRVTGAGEVVVQPMPTEPTLELNWAHARLLHPGVEHSMDLTEVHNRYIVDSDGQHVVATNDDPNSVTSTVSRGFYSDVYDSSPVRVNGETLQAYAERKLEEDSTVDDERTYEREWWPDVDPFDVVRGSLSSVLLDGDMRVKSQSLQVGRGVVVTETSAREVVLWHR